MKRGDGEPPRDGHDEDVGYCKPPGRTRFKPGQSGNPKGRPKRALGKHRRLVEAMDQPTREMFMAEMQRPIAIKTIAGAEVTMPTIQMIARALAKTAAEGGQQAQRTALTLQLELEREAAAENAKILAEVREYKAVAGPIFAECRSLGVPEPGLLPHPDDIFIDEERRRAEIRGPRTAEQRAALDKILAQRDGYQRGVTGLQAEASAKPRDWTLPILAAMAQERFDIINNLLPERYRKKLENRMTPAQMEAAREKARKGSAARKRRLDRRRRAAAKARKSRDGVRGS